jgi:hypothetical protein
MCTSYFSSKLPMEMAMAEHNQAASLLGSHQPLTMEAQCHANLLSL